MGMDVDMAVVPVLSEILSGAATSGTHTASFVEVVVNSEQCKITNVCKMLPPSPQVMFRSPTNPPMLFKSSSLL